MHNATTKAQNPPFFKWLPRKPTKQRLAQNTKRTEEEN
jgi:hypothetical protein